MGSLADALNKMEYQLQVLVEGNLSKLLGSDNIPIPIAHQLITALRGNVKSDKSGKLIAPNSITICADTNFGNYLKLHPGILEELSQQIEAAGFQAGIYFTEPPYLRVECEKSYSPGTVTFQFEPDLQHPGTTAILPTIASRNKKVGIQHAYLIIEGENVINLTEPVINIGRRSDNHIVINDKRVSRQHAQLRLTEDHYIIFDLQSSGGTYVNSQRIHQYSLHPGDVISLAGVTIVFGQEPHSDLGKTQEYRPETNTD